MVLSTLSYAAFAKLIPSSPCTHVSLPASPSIMTHSAHTYNANDVPLPAYTANYHQASLAPSACGQAYNKSIYSPCSKPSIFGSLRAKHTLANAGGFTATATKAAAASVQKEHPAASAVNADEGSEDYAGGLCIVCFDAERSAILAPCGHVAMCRWVCLQTWLCSCILTNLQSCTCLHAQRDM